jgi:hypothetical protein
MDVINKPSPKSDKDTIFFLIISISSVIMLYFFIFFVHDILNASYDNRDNMRFISEPAQILHEYSVFIKLLLSILSKSENPLAKYITLQAGELYNDIFTTFPKTIGAPDSVIKYIQDMPKVFAGRPHIQNIVYKVIDFFQEHKIFDEMMVDVAKDIVKLASIYFNITYGLTIDRGALKILDRDTQNLLQNLPVDQNLSVTPNITLIKYFSGLKTLSQANANLHVIVNSGQRLDIYNSYINYFIICLEVIKDCFDGKCTKKFNEELKERLKGEINFEILDTLYKVHYKIQLLFLNILIESYNESLKGGRRRKSRKNRKNNKNKMSKTSKKRFKSKRRYSKTKRSLLYKSFL